MLMYVLPVLPCTSENDLDYGHYKKASFRILLAKKIRLNIIWLCTGVCKYTTEIMFYIFVMHNVVQKFDCEIG